MSVSPCCPMWLVTDALSLSLLQDASGRVADVSQTNLPVQYFLALSDEIVPKRAVLSCLLHERAD